MRSPGEGTEALSLSAGGVAVARKGTEEGDASHVSDPLQVTAGGAKRNMEPERRLSASAAEPSGSELAGVSPERSSLCSLLPVFSEIQTLVERSNIINVSVASCILRYCLLNIILCFTD